MASPPPLVVRDPMMSTPSTDGSDCIRSLVVICCMGNSTPWVFLRGATGGYRTSLCEPLCAIGMRIEEKRLTQDHRDDQSSSGRRHRQPLVAMTEGVPKLGDPWGRADDGQHVGQTRPTAQP